MNSDEGERKVVIIGGGLVGALNACFLAKRGFKVDLFEYRNDIRKLEHITGKSINLSLSNRGRKALEQIGLEKEIVEEHGIPMYGRMIHGLDGTRRPIYYGTKDQYILSVSRRYLNELLLTAAEKFPNLDIHFQHKLIRADLYEGKGTFQTCSMEKEITFQADLFVGCDGAFSAMRREMTKLPGFNYSQTYIEHGYLELYMPPTADGNFAMEGNFLHIWPRESFMLIALPNQDRSWTVTLFLPFSKFNNLKSPDDVLTFFNENFPDAVPLIGKSRLTEDFFLVSPSHLVSVKCSPYHIGNSAIILGDAAHAMVPFYGQGMNAGFEDCTIFNKLLDKHRNDFGLTLAEFSSFRKPDAEAICDLAMYNYVEMRHLVNSRAFLFRKKLDKVLHSLLSDKWIPLYTMVTFSDLRYHEIIKARQNQDRILKFVGIGSAILFSIAVPIFLKLQKIALEI